jgi:hypothetical protein
MSGAVVHNPEDAAGRLIGFLAHDLAHQASHGRNTVLGFTTSEDLSAVNIPRRQVDPSALAKILTLHSGGALRRGRQSWLFAATSLNAGLFVGGDNVVVGSPWGRASRPGNRARANRLRHLLTI